MNTPQFLQANSQEIWENNPEWVEQLDYQYITPLRELGFTLKSYGELSPNNEANPDTPTYEALHLLVFNHNHVNYGGAANMDEFHQKITDLMQDDDGQPYAAYRYYMGTVWLIIPCLL